MANPIDNYEVITDAGGYSSGDDDAVYTPASTKYIDKTTGKEVSAREYRSKTNQSTATEKLSDQILGQGLTGKWSGQGHGNPEANALNMAQILDGIGITDIKQLGKVPTYKPADIGGYVVNGNIATKDRNGNWNYEEGTGQQVFDSESGNYYSETRTVTVPAKDANPQPIYGEAFAGDDVSPPSFSPYSNDQLTFKDGKALIKTGETFGNKVTGQAVPNTYSERQRGNFFGGTFAGSGNTGYGVQFGPDGTPYFYTQGASSSNMGDFAPLLAMASFIPGVAPFAQGLNALIAAKSGDPLGAIAGLAGLGDFAGISGAADVANAARFAGAAQSGDPLAILMSGANLGGVTDIGGVNLKDVSQGIGAVKAIESGDPLAILRSATGYMGGSGENPNPEDFIEGYFQPGGEGYIAPEPPISDTTGLDEGPTIPVSEPPAPEPPTPEPPADVVTELEKAGLEEKPIDPTIPTPEPDMGESVFDPTFGGTLPLDDLPYLPTDDDFVPTSEIEKPEEAAPDIVDQLLNSGMPSPDEDFVPTLPAETQASTGPGYYDEITGEFIPDENGGLQGPLGPETGNFDPNQEWEYSLTRPGVWTNKEGEEIDLSYMPDRDTAMTGAELMERAGASPGAFRAGIRPPQGGGSGGAAPRPGGQPRPPTGGQPRPTTGGGAGGVNAGGPRNPAASRNPAVDTIAGLAAQQQKNSLLNMMMNDKSEGAKIKSYQELFGEGLFGDTYVPPSARGYEPAPQPQFQSQDDDIEQFFRGGDVTDIDTLLQILRS